MNEYTRGQMQSYLSGFGRQLTSTVKILLIVQAVVFFFQLLLNSTPATAQIFGMVPALFLRGALWQPLTALVFHWNLVSLLADLLVLWFFAPDVELALGGGRRFAIFYLLCGVLSNAVAAVLAPVSSAAILGPAGATFGILAAYASFFPQRVVTLLLFFIIPVEMKAVMLVVIFGAMELFVLMEGHFGNIAGYSALAGIGVGYVLTRNRRLIELFCGGWPAVGNRGQPQVESRQDSQQFIQKKIDPILDKIARDGFQSLTWWEKRILRKATEKMKRL